MEETIKGKLAAKFGDAIQEIKVVRPRRMTVTIDRAQLLPVVRHLVAEEKLVYISTITGVDAGERYEILYHFNLHDRVELTLKALVPKDQYQPTIDAITPLVPGAVFYEREIFDLLGVRAVGHPNLARIALPEDHPADDHPLRKDWKPIHPKGGHAPRTDAGYASPNAPAAASAAKA